jgi:hypothetical protein
MRETKRHAAVRGRMGHWHCLLLIAYHSCALEPEEAAGLPRAAMNCVCRRKLVAATQR